MVNSLISIIEEDALRIVNAVDLRNLKGKSILLTGASGLIGTYLLASLRELVKIGKAPLNVVAMVQSEPTMFLKELASFKGARIIRGDITNFEFVVGLGQFDFIIHAAGYGQPGRFMEDPVKTLKINTSATLSLFDRLTVDGSFLFISSSEVYSGLETSPHRESQIGVTNTTHTRSCYIESKRGGEAICNAYRTRGVRASSARLALAYGPGTKQGDHRVLNSFIERGLINKKIILQDMGTARRTYCYVSDAVEVLWQILINGTEPIYNVGGKSRTTIAELANKVGELLDIPVIFPVDAREISGAPGEVFLDMNLAERQFKKTQYLSLNEGLARTIEWQRAIYLQCIVDKE
jgi:UDP-glucuronate decarboxylase